MIRTYTYHGQTITIEYFDEDDDGIPQNYAVEINGARIYLSGPGSILKLALEHIDTQLNGRKNQI